MKKGLSTVLAALCALCMTASVADAGINVQTYTGRVTATAYDDTPYNLVCSGKVYGTTASGQTYWAYMNNIVITPGHGAYVFVTTNPYNDPFTSGWSDIACVVP